MLLIQQHVILTRNLAGSHLRYVQVIPVIVTLNWPKRVCEITGYVVCCFILVWMFVELYSWTYFIVHRAVFGCYMYCSCNGALQDSTAFSSKWECVWSSQMVWRQLLELCPRRFAWCQHVVCSHVLLLIPGTTVLFLYCCLSDISDCASGWPLLSL